MRTIRGLPGVPAARGGWIGARAAALAVAGVFAFMAPAAAADLAGRAAVIDGDTLEVRGERVRLFGIDAPESGQICVAAGRRWRCGQQATLALDERISGQSVDCKEKDRDRFGRVVAVCRVAGEDLGAWLVSEGWALAYRRYAVDYVEAEERARTARAGIWRGTFRAPWEWRRQRPASPAAEERGIEWVADRRGSCTIKGNVSTGGERIYHVPGGAFYDRTEINEAEGERWFCSEAEARAAGWRASRR